MDLEKAELAKQRLTWVASVATSAYLIDLACYVYLKWVDVAAMPPNNVGDFLAGAFGPLAIFWFVIGYFQQGQELSQNTMALLLQHKEMQASVQQAAELVATAKKEQEASQERWIEERSLRTAERAVKLVPSSHATGTAMLNSGVIGSSLSLHFRNLGGVAVNLSATSKDLKVDAELRTKEFADRGHQIGLTLYWDPTDFPDDPYYVTVAISYTDSDAHDLVDEFVVRGNWRSSKKETFAVLYNQTTRDW